MFQIKTTRISNLVLSAAASLAMVTAVSAPVQADSSTFQTMSGNQHIAAGERAISDRNYARAAQHYRAASQQHLKRPDRVLAANNLCASETILGNIVAAEAACDAAIKLDRNYWRAWLNRGHVAHQSGNLNKAHKSYLMALRTSNRNKISRTAFRNFKQHVKTESANKTLVAQNNTQ